MNFLYTEKPESSPLCDQRFFRNMCVSAKVPALVKLCHQALKEDKCVVIGLQSTGEARTEEAVEKYGTELENFVSETRELLLKFVEEYFPLPEKPESLSGLDGVEVLQRKRRSETTGVSFKGRAWKAVKYQEESDTDSETDSEPESTESDDEFQICEICKSEVLGGHDKVAEITGRHRRLIKASSEDSVKYVARNPKDVHMEMVNMYKKQSFMDGTKLVAIISEAGSAGVSLQADRRVKNQV